MFEPENNAADTSAPPAYSDRLSLDTGETPDVQDGRINIDFDSKLGRAFSSLFPVPPVPDKERPLPNKFLDDPPVYSPWDLPLNIVIQVVGSRGDVQPFIALGNELQRHGHRVRLATHDVFEQFVLQAGLEFFPIGGDPAQLMAYMVKNPGLIPGMKTLREGEIQRKRAMIGEMLDGCWRSCIEPDPRSKRTFVAQAIIANPVSFAHVHCAQVLSIPVHLMFTMPWTSTRAFPHPLANIKDSKHEPRLANYLSYGVVEWMTWQGIGGVINAWREKSLCLEAVPTSEGPLLASTLSIPHTYCWSTALVPKPADWRSHIDVCGFFFREPPAYTPSPELENFLTSGPRPIYIGFGSIVIEDSSRLTEILLEAIEICGVRAIISRGWSKIGGPSGSRDIFYLDDCPHEWLFQQVSAVVHHGGAGTTACGLLNARPTLVIPFFGDQQFWGHMIASAKAGPPPIPHKALNSRNLADAIDFCMTAEAAKAAGDIAVKMRGENGVAQAVVSFHRQLPRTKMSCEMVSGQPATWVYTNCKRPIRLSNTAVRILSQTPDFKMKEKHLTHYGPSPILIKNKRWDPVTSLSSTGLGMASDITTSTVGIFADPVKVYLDNNKPGASSKSQLELGGRAALASARSMDHLAVKAFKGGAVDLPLAVAEGFRNVPRLWGQTVAEQDEITGWKSGATVAGKSFVHGFYDGVGGFFFKPYKGARDGGVLGFAKGCGKGLSGIVTGPVSGTFGVFGYAGDGISQSIDRAVHQKARKRILAAKEAEVEHMTRYGNNVTGNHDIVQAFCERRKL